MNPARPRAGIAGTISSPGCSVGLLTFEFSNHVRDKIAAVERREVFELFAGTDETRGQSEFFLNRDHDSAFAAAVEFRHDQSGEADRLVKFARLRKSVAASRRVHHQ